MLQLAPPTFLSPTCFPSPTHFSKPHPVCYPIQLQFSSNISTLYPPYMYLSTLYIYLTRNNDTQRCNVAVVSATCQLVTSLPVWSSLHPHPTPTCHPSPHARAQSHTTGCQHAVCYNTAIVRGLPSAIWGVPTCCCLCCLTYGSGHWTLFSSGYSDGG